jgi:integrase
MGANSNTNDVAQVEFSEFIRAYLDAVKNRLRSYRQIRWRMRRFLGLYTGRQLGDITRRDIADYIDKRLDDGLCNGTVNLEISTLSSAFRFAQRHWGWPITNPVSGQYLRNDEGRLRWLDKDETARLFRTMRGSRARISLPDFVQLAINTGCRKSELLGLAWKNVDLDAGIVIIEGKNSKNGRRRIIPINQGARQALQNREDHNRKYCPESPWVFAKRNGERLKHIDGQFKHCIRKAGIEDFRIHDLRHTFASWLVTKDVPLYHVKELLGHSTIKMTERYAHLATTALSKAVAVLDDDE